MENLKIPLSVGIHFVDHNFDSIEESNVSTVKASPEKAMQESPIHQKLNRDIVLKDIVDSERVNVAELQGLINSFLHPLDVANM